jgi:hypothetical protein
MRLGHVLYGHKLTVLSDVLVLLLLLTDLLLYITHGHDSGVHALRLFRPYAETNINQPNPTQPKQAK